MKKLPLLRWAAWAAAVWMAGLVASAQPSGGPYGPLVQSYGVPENGVNWFVAPEGRAEASGRTLEEPTSLAEAVARAESGATIILRGGVYRVGGLSLNQGVTIQPYLEEQPVLKGTEVATEWEALRDGLWRTRWTKLFPMKPEGWWRRHREGMRTPLHKFNNDMVFVDGRPLKSAGWEGETGPDSFFIDYEGGWVYLRQDPKGKQIEITAHDVALLRTTKPVHGRVSDKRGYTLRGLTLTQYAYRALEVEGHEPEGPETEAQFGKDVVGTTIEHCSITHCSRVAGYFRGDRFVLRHCLVSDTSTEGIYLIASSDSLLEKNLIRRNNVEGITGYYPSAVKIFNQTHRVVCRDNYITDNRDSNGIWYDVGNCDGVFVNNWIEDSQAGFFYEISQNAVCAGNVFVRCDKGVYVLNASGVKVYHNTFVDSPVSIERTERSAQGDHFGWHPATGPDVEQRVGHEVVGNLLLATEVYSKPLLRLEQSAAVRERLQMAQTARVAQNLYVRSPAVTGPLYLWSPGVEKTGVGEVADVSRLQELRPGEEKDSQLWVRDPRAVVQSIELDRLQLLSGVPVSVTPLQEVRRLLGWPEQGTYAPGAYPLAPR